MKTKLLPSLLVLFASLVLASAMQAAVLRVVRVETTDVDAYVKQLTIGTEILKKEGSPVVIRVWVASFAGEGAGSVVVALEYADLTTLAKDREKMAKSAAYTAWLKNLSSIRKVVSDSIYDERQL